MKILRSLTAEVVVAAMFLSGSSVVFAQAPDSLPQQALNHMPVCPPGLSGVHCNSQVVVNKNGKPQPNPFPNGYTKTQFRTAYKLSGRTNINQTIAIVDAYHNPNMLSDLNAYSASTGLPAMNACPASAGTTNAPCFEQVDQNGGANFPPVDSAWALETALDVEVAHAACENCNILLVEADSAQMSDMLSAVDQAVAQGADVISNSYGGNESAGETLYDSHFQNAQNHNIAVTASSGDKGYGVQYPAASPFVTAVGGTTLRVDSGSNRVSETAWSGAGSGCSAYEPQPSAQKQLNLKGCTGRMVADVSAVADPSTGAAVYTTTPYQGATGWFVVGGTSLAAPLIAAIYAQAGNAGSITPANGYLYGQASFLNDITSGSNGRCSKGAQYLCTAVRGYDGPTGMGTPIGTGAF